MPPLRLTNILQRTLPHLSTDGRAILNALGCMNGRCSGPAELASWLGFHDRYQLTRALRRNGLPPLEELGGWTRTLYWMLEAETTGVSLRELAAREHVDPAVAYRLVRRVTGLRWMEARREGIDGTMQRLRNRCAPRAQSTEAQQPPVRTGDTGTYAGAGRAREAQGSHWVRPERRQNGPRQTGSLSERIPITGAPFDVAVLPNGTALVTRAHAAAVDVLHLFDAGGHSPRVTDTIRVGPAPTRVTPSMRTRWAYVTSQFAEAVCVVDLEWRQQVATIPIPGHPLGAVLSPDERTLFVTTNQDRLVAISTAQRSVLGVAQVPHGCPQITMHPSGRWIFVSCWRAGCVVEVDALTLQITRRFEVGGTAQDVLVSSDGQTLYVANECGWLDVIHLPSARLSATIKFGKGAIGLAMSADESDVFVGLFNAGQIAVVDRTSLRVRKIIETGGRPRLMATHAESRVTLAANEDGWVDFIR